MKSFRIHYTDYLTGILVILLSGLLLFYIDHETRSITDLFKPVNLVALMIYFIPTGLVCFGIYAFLQFRGNKNCLLWSLVIGIPVGFGLVILALSFFMGRL